jgi:hypothetical protein
MTDTGMGFLFWHNENVLELDNGNGCTLCEHINHH